ncbi:MAG: HAD family hydrolase [Candidatus Thorarchaeota archaeon]
MLIKGILFDLYGTLLISRNSKKAWKNWLITFYKYLKCYGLDLTKRNFVRICTDFFTKPEPSKLLNNLTVYENRIKYFSDNLGLNLKEFEIKETAYACVDAWHQYLRIDLEAVPLLRKLKKSKKLALITNFDHPPYIYSILNKYNSLEYFDEITISGEVGFKKPDPSIFLMTLKKMDLTSQDVIYIGDSKEDIIGATKAGIKPILIQRKKIIGNDYRAKNSSEFMNIEDLKQYNYTKISTLKEILDLVEN